MQVSPCPPHINFWEEGNCHAYRATKLSRNLSRIAVRATRDVITCQVETGGPVQYMYIPAGIHIPLQVQARVAVASAPSMQSSTPTATARTRSSQTSSTTSSARYGISPSWQPPAARAGRPTDTVPGRPDIGTSSKASRAPRPTPLQWTRPATPSHCSRPRKRTYSVISTNFGNGPARATPALQRAKSARTYWCERSVREQQRGRYGRPITRGEGISLPWHWMWALPTSTARSRPPACLRLGQTSVSSRVTYSPGAFVFPRPSTTAASSSSRS